LSPGALPLAVLLPARGPRRLRPGRAGPGPDDRRARTGGEGDARRRDRVGLRAPRGGRLPQHGGRARRRRQRARPLPQDAHPQRGLRGGREPRRARGPGRRRPRVLGRLVRVRSLRRGAEGGLAQRRGDPRRRVRPRPPGGGAAQLALPPRPPHRRLRGDHQAPARRVTTPAALGYRMPAEWEPHAATWLAWPHERSDWPGKFAAIPWVYAEVVRHLVPGERVRILVGDAVSERSARRVLARSGVDVRRVDFFRVPTDRSWTRDFCPLFVRRDDGDVALTNWKFNGWAKYPNWKRDAAVPDRLAKLLRHRQWKPGLVLEGGSIDVNGRGTLLTTEECLLSPVQARNPGVERAELERALHDYLGVRKV